MRQWLVLSRSKGYKGPYGLTRTMAVAGVRLVTGRGPWRLVTWSMEDPDKDSGPLRARADSLTNLRRRLSAGGVGDVFSLKRADGTEDFRAREAQPAVNLIDTNGNDAVDKVFSFEKAAFPNISYLGSYNCRYIAGSNTLSQHAYGNAVDVSAPTMAEMRGIAGWVVAHGEELSPKHVIVADSIWTHGSGWSHYGGDYHWHVHVDCDPNFSGPCGVKPAGQ